jgi:hypothetical protein
MHTNQMQQRTLTIVEIRLKLLVEVKFNPCKIISHYCKNIFALQHAHIHNFFRDFKHT